MGVVLVTGLTSADLLRFQPLEVSHCEEFDDDYDSGYTEAERFFHSLEYHRSLLPDYERRWLHDSGIIKIPTTKTGRPKEAWPRNVPRSSEMPALELDLKFCERSLQSQKGDLKKCQDLRFRVASYLILQTNEADQRKGFKVLKDLAVKGHADGMCLYGIVLNQGIVAVVDPNPEQAVVWWRRCSDEYPHITATYELAIAMYIGDGLPENTVFAVKLFRRAAHLGHAGAAYMLGECLLEGVGVERDRGDALEWLVTAAELGHYLARSRVFNILEQEYEMLDAGQALSERRLQEAEKWANENQVVTLSTVNIERRFSIGGGSQNPAVLESRKSIIAESRGEFPIEEEKE